MNAGLAAARPRQPPTRSGRPGRRTEGRRRFSVREYAPPLAIIHQWLPRTPALGVKISPGVDLAELDAGLAAPAGRRPAAWELEFISVHGDLKEAVLWFGPLRTSAAPATLLPGPHTLTAEAREPAPELAAPQQYFYEPDPAILRAGLVTTLAAQLGARQIDPEIAYLTADTLTPTPFARAFALDDALPFQLKRPCAPVRARQVGTVTVKKRGSPLLIRQLKLSGPESRLLFLTHVAGAPYVLIGRAVSGAAA